MKKSKNMFTFLTQYTNVTDRQTDSRTLHDSILYRSCLCRHCVV